jgi:hypothetical protein
LPRPQRLAFTSRLHRSIDARFAKIPAAQLLFAIYGFADASLARIFCFRLSATRALFDRSAALGVASARQHFLKRDAVFFDALVYSE